MKQISCDESQFSKPIKTSGINTSSLILPPLVSDESIYDSDLKNCQRKKLEEIALPLNSLLKTSKEGRAGF